MLDRLDLRSNQSPNTLTQEERDAIDAFPKSKVQKIPTGTSGLYQWPQKWDGRRLVSVDDDGKPLSHSAVIRHMKGDMSNPLANAKRGDAYRNRNEVVRCVEAGHTNPSEIVAITGLSPATVAKYLKTIMARK